MNSLIRLSIWGKSMKVLLSIKPEFVDKIFSGEKLYEYRKVCFSRRDIKTIVVYATQPVGRIVGEFDIDNIIEDSPSSIWNTTKKYSGITKSFFLNYFSGREIAYAIKIRSVRRYSEWVDPNIAFDKFSPPQSFRYIEQ